MAKTRLQEKYLSEVVKGLVDKFQYKNVNEIPKVEKVIINMGVGEAVANAKALETAVSELVTIAGQKPVVTKAKKSIAAFKLRAGMPIGAPWQACQQGHEKAQLQVEADRHGVDGDVEHDTSLVNEEYPRDVQDRQPPDRT